MTCVTYFHCQVYYFGMNPIPRFLCDEMLGRLCRYLRAAGYDALLANGDRSDGELLRQCREEGRYFLTQDQLVHEHKAARGVGLLLPPGRGPPPPPMRSGRMNRCVIARRAGGSTGAAHTTSACARSWPHGRRLK